MNLNSLVDFLKGKFEEYTSSSRGGSYPGAQQGARYPIPVTLRLAAIDRYSSSIDQVMWYDYDRC